MQIKVEGCLSGIADEIVAAKAVKVARLSVNRGDHSASPRRCKQCLRFARLARVDVVENAARKSPEFTSPQQPALCPILSLRADQTELSTITPAEGTRVGISFGEASFRLPRRGFGGDDHKPFVHPHCYTMDRLGRSRSKHFQLYRPNQPPQATSQLFSRFQGRLHRKQLLLLQAGLPDRDRRRIADFFERLSFFREHPRTSI